MNENLSQLLKVADKEALKPFRRNVGIDVEIDLQSIKTSIELFGKMLDALNEGLKNGDKNSKLIDLMEFYARVMIYNEFKTVLKYIDNEKKVEWIKTY